MLQKQHFIGIRVTDTLYQVLLRNSRDAGLSMSEYIRKVLMHQKIILKPEIVFDDSKLLEALANLGRIGNNINQIARYLNEGGRPTSSMYQDLTHCITELHQIRDDVHEMAGDYHGHH